MGLLKEKIKFYQDNPTIGVRDLLSLDNGKPLQLHWTQRQMIRAAWRTTNCLWLACRSLGKTFLAAVILCLKCLLFRNTKCGIFASSYEQACFTFEKIQTLWDNSPILQAETFGPPSITKQKAELLFKNGSSIKAFPVRRGARFSFVFIDEYRDISPDQLAVIKPYLLAKQNSEKNQMLIASTATYETNHFYPKYKEFEEQVNKKNPAYAMTAFDIDDVLSGDFTYIDEDIVESLKNELLDEEIEMELYCRFVGLRDGWIPGPLIRECEADYKPYIKGQNGDIFICGADLGRVKGGDNSAFCIGQVIPNVGVRVVRLVTLNGASIEQQRLVLGQLLKDFNVIKLIMDNEKLGYSLRDAFERPMVDPRDNTILPPIVTEDNYDVKDALKIITPVNFAKKDDIWQRCWLTKKGMQDKILFFPQDYYRIHINLHEIKDIDEKEREIIEMCQEIAQLKKEMSNMKLKANETNTSYTLVPDSTGKTKDDRFYSLILMASSAIEFYKELSENKNDSFVGCIG
jgi:hypothetical protein